MVITKTFDDIDKDKNGQLEWREFAEFISSASAESLFANGPQQAPKHALWAQWIP